MKMRLYTLLKQNRANSQHRRPLVTIGLSCVAFAIVGIGAIVWPLYAAMELNYFDVFVGEDKLTIEWSTASENDLLGFQLYCKEEDEPNNKYHVIAERLAQGSQAQGAVYRVDVTEGIEPNTSYCFRLEELPMNNQQGEIIDRCGYGFNITPTPVSTPTMTTAATISDTQEITSELVLTATVVQPIVITATPVLTDSSTVSPSLSGAVSDTATPSAENSDAGVVFPTATTESEPQFTPSVVEEVTATATPISQSPLLPTITITAPVDGEASETILAPDIVQSSRGLSTTLENTSSAPDQSIAMQSNAQSADTTVANPPYIILTATPTPVALAQIPTFTPFPITINTIESNPIAAAIPNTQSLMILLLCGVFSGASGLGILGLVTTLLYMRSRNSEQQNNRPNYPHQ
ncbi:MAG: hypothetical protein R2932_04885 [Caldilineaceae bacterium]